MYQSNRSLNIPTPGQPPGHLNFWKIFVQIPHSRGRKAVQMPHHRSIPGDQTPPPPGNFSVAFIMLRNALIEDTLRAQLYGLGYPRQPSPRATLAEVTFSLFLSKIQPTVYIRIANSSRGARQLGWASCLTSAGRVTLASGTTFLHINALARLTGTSLGVANVT